MGNPRLYQIIGAGILVFIVVTGIMIFMSSGMEEYEVINYNSTDLEFLQNVSENFKDIAPEFNNASSIDVSPTDSDKQGTLLSKAQSALETTEDSMTFFSKITTRLGSMLGLGEYSNIIIGGSVAFILIVMIFAIGLKALFRTDL